MGNLVDGAELVARMGEATHHCKVPEGQTLLHSLFTVGCEAPHSCEIGMCGSCKARLLSGSVQMPPVQMKAQEAVDAGYILLCQARPTAAEIEVEIEVEIAPPRRV